MGEQLVEDPPTSTVFEAKGMLLSSFSRLFEFFQNDVLCDVVICVGQKSIKCHRAVLASCSPYFQAMFTSPLKESHQTSVTIGDIDETTMEMLIAFAYTAKIELNIGNIQSVLHASSVFQLDSLLQACCDFMCLQLTTGNCLAISQFADRHGLLTLVNRCDSFAKLHFQELMLSKEFCDIDASHLQQLISSDELCVTSEQQVFAALMIWMSANAERKVQFLPQMLSRVRLPLLSLSFLQTKVESVDLIRNNIECRDLMDEARDYALWQAGQLPIVHLPINERTRPRKSYAGVLFCVGGRGSSSNPFSSVECYSWFHDKWLKIGDLSTPRRHVGCVSTNNKIYAVGGCNEKEHMSSAEVFDPLSCQWTPISPMSTPRRGLGLCCVRGPIFAVGGLDDSVFYSVVERYDITSDFWSTVAPMNTARGGVAVAEFKGMLYAFGGNSGPVSLSSCEVYNPYLNKWTFISSMNQCRAGAGVAVLDGFIYVFGGFDNNLPLSCAERYNAETDSWEFIASLNMSRGGVGAAELGKRIYAIGGHNGTNYLKTVEVYDGRIDKWSYSTSIMNCRAGAGVVCCPCDVDTVNRLSKQFTVKTEPCT